MNKFLTLLTILVFTSAHTTFAGWALVVNNSDTIATPPSTYTLSGTITDTPATGSTFTIDGTAYDATDSPISISGLDSATQSIAFTANTDELGNCTGTGLTGTTDTGPWAVDMSSADVTDLACTVSAGGTKYYSTGADVSGVTGTTNTESATTSHGNVALSQLPTTGTIVGVGTWVESVTTATTLKFGLWVKDFSVYGNNNYHAISYGTVTPVAGWSDATLTTSYTIAGTEEAIEFAVIGNGDWVMKKSTSGDSVYVNVAYADFEADHNFSGTAGRNYGMRYEVE